MPPITRGKEKRLRSLREDEIAGRLPQISNEMWKDIDFWMSAGSISRKLVKKFKYKIRRRDLQTLKDSNWLNDEVINFYMHLIMDRSSNRSDLPKAYCFTTFFYEKLMSGGGGHSAVKRWTKKVDIFTYDVIIIPINLTAHWCLASVHLKEKKINYYDSMGGDNDHCLEALAKYLQEEKKEKKNEVLTLEGWTLANVKNIPQQTNGSDCGIFACTFAEFLARGAPFNFDQEQMPYFRAKMAYEIVTADLLIQK